jgi:malate synthase
MNYGGSGMEKAVIDWIKEHVPRESIIVEFGAGDVSTKELCNDYQLYSIEHDREWIGKYDSHYIYAPKVDGWYNPHIVDSVFRKVEPYLVIIDGIGRDRILNRIDLVQNCKMILVHDTNRDLDRNTAIRLATELNKMVRFYEDGDFWAVVS